MCVKTEGVRHCVMDDNETWPVNVDLKIQLVS